MIDLIRLLLSVSDWPIIMIAPGGLLSVVPLPPHLICYPQCFSLLLGVCGGGLQKKKVDN